MQFAIQGSNRMTVTGKNLTITPTANGFEINEPTANDGAPASTSTGAKRGRKPKSEILVQHDERQESLV